VDICRAISALLVFYSHISVLWVQVRGESAPVIRFIDTMTSNPMHMANQGIGQIGVPIFFMVSGFVVTPIALRMGSVKFGLNRLLRIYPPLIVTVLLATLVLSIGLKPLDTGQEQTVNALNVLTNVTLANYFLVPQVVFVGVAWTLIVEIIFYVLLMMLIPVFREWTWLALSIELTFVLIVLMSRKQFGSGYFLFSVSVSYLPIILIGQTIWAVKDKKIPIWSGGLFIGGAWSLYVLADILQMGRLDTSYNLALAFAMVCFLMAMFAEPHLRERPIWTGLSERAYSLYLLHGIAGFAMLDLLKDVLPLWASIIIAVGVTFGFVELCYRFVEKPTHEFARKVSRRSTPIPEPASVAVAEPVAPPVVRERAPEWPVDDRTMEIPTVRALRPPPAARHNGGTNGRPAPRNVDHLARDGSRMPPPEPSLQPGTNGLPRRARPIPSERSNGFSRPVNEDGGYRPRHARRPQE
jgi:peptidoglycan/LPS O-acetylase OafA/YrhL